MKPNVLWLFADQLRYHALSCSGDLNVRTPNIDRLATEGVRCTGAYSDYPVCVPFRAGLMTGQHATTCGAPLHGDILHYDRRTIAHAFRETGYRTSYVGKWHLAGEHGINRVSEAGWAGEDYRVHPDLRGGFEDWFGFNLSNNFYPTCAGLCGVSADPGVQGLNLSGALDGTGAPERTEAYIQWVGQTHFGFGDHPYRGIRTPRHTYVVGRDEEFCLLFDNEADPFQMENLFGRSEAADLQQSLHQRLTRTILNAGEAVPEFIRRAGRHPSAGQAARQEH